MLQLQEIIEIIIKIYEIFSRKFREIEPILKQKFPSFSKKSIHFGRSENKCKCEQNV